jgi:SAM-dependent methyltransferase
MTKFDLLHKVSDCFRNKIDLHGATPEGVFWNSIEAQAIRFAQIIKVCDKATPFSLIDYGCGYGALITYLDLQECSFRYTGFDIAEAMISRAFEIYGKRSDCAFYSDESQLVPCDYAVESGIFNLKLDAPVDLWTEHVLRTLDRLHVLGEKGFAFNMLTKYSDPERMRPDLYYADPSFFFDYCKRNYSRNVALLHDYELYDFTILVRK